MWKVLCRVDELKQKMVDRFSASQGEDEVPFKRSCVYYQQNTLRITEKDALATHTTEFGNFIQRLDTPFDEDLDNDIRESLLAIDKELSVKTPEELYAHYRD